MVLQQKQYKELINKNETKVYVLFYIKKQTANQQKQTPITNIYKSTAIKKKASEHLHKQAAIKNSV